jgi:transcriptional regulator with XRE-family HTH domain
MNEFLDSDVELVDPRQPVQSGIAPTTGTARSRYLGAQLRAQREMTGCTPFQLGRRLRWSPAAIARLEAGLYAVTHAELLDYLYACGTPEPLRTRLLRIGGQRTERQWRVWHGGCSPDTVPGLAEQLECARAVTCYDPVRLPLLLCTPEFALARALAEGIGPEVLGEQLALIRRHALLDPRQRRHWEFCMSQTALHEVPDDGAAGTRQRAYLARVVGAERVTIRILPDYPSERTPSSHRMWWFEFPRGTPAGCVQTAEHSVLSEFVASDDLRDRLRRAQNRTMRDDEAATLIGQLAAVADRDTG